MDIKNKGRKVYQGWDRFFMDIRQVKEREDRGWNMVVVIQGGKV